MTTDYAEAVRLLRLTAEHIEAKGHPVGDVRPTSRVDGATLPCRCGGDALVVEVRAFLASREAPGKCGDYGCTLPAGHADDDTLPEERRVVLDALLPASPTQPAPEVGCAVPEEDAACDPDAPCQRHGCSAYGCDCPGSSEDWVCPDCDGGPGNSYACNCPSSDL